MNRDEGLVNDYVSFNTATLTIVDCLNLGDAVLPLFLKNLILRSAP